MNISLINFRDCANFLSPCNSEDESPSHFLLHYHYYVTYTDIRKTLFHKLQSLDADILNQSDNEITELLLYSSKKFKFYESCSILNSAIRFITKSERFNGSIVK